MLNTKTLAFGVLMAAALPAFAAAADGGSTPTVKTGCHAVYSVADAKVLAAATPNARAFVSNFGATLTTEVARENAGSVAVRVIASDPKNGRQPVGVYTVSLRTGSVIDDDQEPAEDAGTSAVRAKLAAHHCTAK